MYVRKRKRKEVRVYVTIKPEVLNASSVDLMSGHPPVRGEKY